MTIDSSLENLFIYYDNLSVYYVWSIIITFMSVLLAWWYNYKLGPVDVKEIHPSSIIEKSTTLDQTEDTDEERTINNGISEMKKGKQLLFAEEVAANLTEDQLKEEREFLREDIAYALMRREGVTNAGSTEQMTEGVERQQLEAIFNLLQSEEDKFQVTSLEELEDQLKLYRY